MKEATDPWNQSEQDQVEQIWERTLTREREVLWVLSGPCLLVGFMQANFSTPPEHRQPQAAPRFSSSQLCLMRKMSFYFFFNVFKISWRKSVIGLHVPSPKWKATFNRMDHNFYLNTIQVFWLHMAERTMCYLLSRVQLFGPHGL